jgi:hypothetical protein
MPPTRNETRYDAAWPPANVMIAAADASAAGARPVAASPKAVIKATSNAVRISDVSAIFGPFIFILISAR